MSPATVASCLQSASQLASVSDTPRLDIELMLAEVLQKTRTYLFTWPDAVLTENQYAQFHDFFSRRLNGEPMAYILGVREFWSLPFFVNPTTLIPRPDTEILVETVLELFAADSQETPRDLLDLGTGTGAILLSLAHEKPQWHCMGVDKEIAAVELAKKNRDHLQLHHVDLQHSDWFSAIPQGRLFDVIVSNPPYIDADDPHLHQGDVRFEPHSALVADKNGLADIEWICSCAKHYLKPSGILLFEHGYQQAEAVRQLLESNGFIDVYTTKDFGGNDRVTRGRHP